MSFRIFAIGASSPRQFNYERCNCADGDLCEAAAVMSAMRSAGPSARGVAEGVVDYVAPSAESEARSGIQGNLGVALRAHCAQGITLLGQCQDSRQGWISVAVERLGVRRVARVIGGYETTGFARYNFVPNICPGAELMQRVLPVLEATEMNTWGVLQEMDNAFRAYRNLIGPQGRPMIQIQLFK